MKLLPALRVSDSDVVAFVGGGGKTTAMFRLAAEIVESGGRVVTTTTTRIFSAQARLAPVHVHSLPDLQAALQTWPHVLFTNEVDPVEGKTHGISPETIQNLKAQISGTAREQHANLKIPILIEADGSRMRPFKAPADHEPVIPDCTTLVVPVVGIDALGKPLTEKYVHRPELVARIHPGETVTPEMVAAVLASPQGGRKRAPAGARVVPLINKVEDEAQLQTARAIAERLMSMEGIDGVVIGAVAKDDPVVQAYYRWPRHT